MVARTSRIEKSFVISILPDVNTANQEREIIHKWHKADIKDDDAIPGIRHQKNFVILCVLRGLFSSRFFVFLSG